MCNEKELIKAMQAEAKGGGYRLLMDDESLRVMGTRWAAMFPAAKIPRKVLGAVVEHTGGIPYGQCAAVYGVKSGYEMNEYQPEVFEAEYASLCGSPTGERVRNTGVSCWGYWLYSGENGTLRAVVPKLLTLSEAPPTEITDTMALRFEDMEHMGAGEIHIQTFGDSIINNEEKRRALWRAFEKIGWWEKPEEDSEYEQTELEEA